jgi:uncharacterized protein
MLFHGIKDVEEFDWDAGNDLKNVIKHQVSIAEAESIFFNEPLIIVQDDKHSTTEKRYFALGHTDADRNLLAVFTVRAKKIRVISVRDMSKKERAIYEQA